MQHYITTWGSRIVCVTGRIMMAYSVAICFNLLTAKCGYNLSYPVAEWRSASNLGLAHNMTFCKRPPAAVAVPAIVTAFALRSNNSECPHRTSKCSLKYSTSVWKIPVMLPIFLLPVKCQGRKRDSTTPLFSLSLIVWVCDGMEISNRHLKLNKILTNKHLSN